MLNSLTLIGHSLTGVLVGESTLIRSTLLNQTFTVCLHFILLQWFNLNSLLAKPELFTETYLSLYLTQLQTEGDSNIFLMLINLYPCS